MNRRQSLRSFFSEAGELSSFALRFFGQFYRPRYEFSEFFRQCYVIGYQSLPLIGLTGFIMGLVLTIQLRPSLVDYGVESQLPSMISVAIIREMGPVITALIYAGKIGSSIGAELGFMPLWEASISPLGIMIQTEFLPGLISRSTHAENQPNNFIIIALMTGRILRFLTLLPTLKA